MTWQNINFNAAIGTDKYRKFLADWNGGIDPRLKAFFLVLADHVMQKYNQGLTITCLVRSIEYNRLIGGNTRSAHLPTEGRAGDFRSRTFTKIEAAEIVAWTKMVWGNFIHIIHHDSGNGEHFHANINHSFKRNGWRNGGSYGT